MIRIRSIYVDKHICSLCPKWTWSTSGITRSNWSALLRSHEQHQGEHKHRYDWVIEFMKNDLYKTDGFITHRFPYEDYKQAVALANGHKGKPKAIKVVLEI